MSIYNTLDRFLPFDSVLDPIFGGQRQRVPQLPMKTPPITGNGIDPTMGFGDLGRFSAPKPEKKVPKVSKLRVLDRVLAGATFTDAIDTERMRPQMLARMEEEDAMARQVFKDDPRGYLAWRANRDEVGKALATGLEDYTLAPGAVRGRGGQQIARAPTAPQSYAPGTAMVDETGRELYRAPYKPEVTTIGQNESAAVINPNGPDPNQIFDALIQQESGGRGDAVGPQTPYGQALGSTQMLPETARSMAEKLGLPWKPELMTATTPEALDYQRRLGRAYFDEGLQRYGGNVEQALKYYHGGPDESLWGPKTQAYAAAVMGRAGPSATVVAQGSPKPQWRQEGDLQYSPDGKVELVPQRTLPGPALKAEEEDISAISVASNINGMLAGYVSQIDKGQLNLGPVQNLVSQGALLAGMGSTKDRNFGSFRAGLERLRNDSLRLNSGVQTEGDAQRAWNELFGNLNDEGYVRQRLQEIQALNARAIRERQARVDARRTQYGLQPYGQPPSGAPKPPPANPAAPPRKPVQTGSAPERPTAPAKPAATQLDRLGIREGQIVVQGGKRYRRQGNQMIEVR